MREGWTYKKLGEVCDVINGLWTGKKEPFVSVGVIRNANFTKECTLNLDNIAYIDVEEKQFKTRELQYGDIIIEKSGGSDNQPVGRPVFFYLKEKGYSFSNFTAVLRVKEVDVIIPQYLHKALLFQYKQGVTKKLQSKTTGLHNLNFKAYLNCEIPLPPKSQQEAIVSELDEINSLLALKRKQLQAYDKLAQSLFYEMFGDPVENEKGWEVKTIMDLCVLLTDGTHQTPTYTEDAINGVKFLSAKDVTSGHIDWTNIKYIPFELHQELHKRLAPQRNDILLCKNGTTGICALVETDEIFDIYVSLALLRLKEGILPIYMVHAINNPETKYQFDKSLKGIGVPNLHLGEIKKAKVILPPLPLQQQFASRIEQIELQKTQVQAAIEKLETLLASRMQYWFE